MKKYLIVAIITAATFNIGCANSSTETDNNKTVSTNIVEIEYLTADSFKEKVFNYQDSKEWKYKGTTPCIIDFYATWCGPCKQIAPILEDLATEYKGKIIVYKVDVDKQKELAGIFGVKSIPALLFVPMNGKPQMVNGAIPKETFVKAINEVLLKKETVK